MIRTLNFTEFPRDVPGMKTSGPRCPLRIPSIAREVRQLEASNKWLELTYMRFDVEIVNELLESAVLTDLHQKGLDDD